MLRASSYTPHPFVTLGDSTSLTGTLDLSDFSAAYDDTDADITFVASTTVTVNFGSRTLANNKTGAACLTLRASFLEILLEKWGGA